MGTCLHISDDRRSIYVDYPSEPILAEAAASLMEKQSDYVTMLSILENSLKLSIVDTGYRGELVARLILLQFMDHWTSSQTLATRNFFSNTLVNAKEFIEYLSPTHHEEVSNKYSLL